MTLRTEKKWKVVITEHGSMKSLRSEEFDTREEALDFIEYCNEDTTACCYAWLDDRGHESDTP